MAKLRFAHVTRLEHNGKSYNEEECIKHWEMLCTKGNLSTYFVLNEKEQKKVDAYFEKEQQIEDDTSGVQKKEKEAARELARIEHTKHMQELYDIDNKDKLEKEKKEAEEKEIEDSKKSEEEKNKFEEAKKKADETAELRRKAVEDAKNKKELLAAERILALKEKFTQEQIDEMDLTNLSSMSENEFEKILNSEKE